MLGPRTWRCSLCFGFSRLRVARTQARWGPRRLVQVVREVGTMRKRGYTDAPNQAHNSEGGEGRAAGADAATERPLYDAYDLTKRNIAGLARPRQRHLVAMVFDMMVSAPSQG
jgi:hypothetical protein